MKEKGKKSISAIIKLLGKVIKDIYHFSKSYLPLKVLQIIANAIIPFVNIILAKLIIDYIIDSKYISAFTVVIVIFVVNVSHSILNQILSFYFEIKNQQLNKNYEKELMNKVMSIDYELVEVASTQNMKEQAKTGAANIQEFILNVQSIITSIIILVSATYIITSLNVFIAVLIFCIVIFNGYINYRKNKLDIDLDKSFADLGRRWGYLNYICRDIANAKEIRFHHLSKWLSKKITFFVHDHESIIRSSFHNQSVARRFAALSEMIQNGVVYFYIGLQLWENKITVGSFTQYIAAIQMVSSNLVSIISTVLNINKNKHFIQNYYDFIQLEDSCRDCNKNICPDRSNGYCIEIKDIWFRYNVESDYVLKGLSLVISAGERLSVVGRNGCGKTTLVKLLLRLYRPESGQILMNGKDIYEYDYDEYCKLFSVIFQDYKIFSFTIQDNILMSDMPIDPDEKDLPECILSKMQIAIEKANLSPIINNFPNKIYTYVNKNYTLDGYELSGGMQQSLAMSRAYYRNANQIILDEPTAMLDPINECRMYENFNQLIGNKTAIYISHRMSSSRFCDKIVYIQDGVVKEYGSHDELMKLDGLYAILFNKQAELFAEAE